MSAGVVANGGMGTTGLSWVDVKTWSDLTGVVMTPWEAETLYEMSSAYAISLERAKDPECPPPWTPSVAQTRAQVSQSLASFLDSLVDGKRSGR